METTIGSGYEKITLKGTQLTFFSDQCLRWVTRDIFQIPQTEWWNFEKEIHALVWRARRQAQMMN